MHRIGIITYHAAYNYGSALQAFATQMAVNKLSGSSVIINYRLDEQKYFYETLYRTKYGLKVLLKDLTLLPYEKKRKERAERFEEFFLNYYTLTEEVSEPEEIQNLWIDFDLAVSGSDQILSKQSHELRNNDWKYMDPYLLKGFTGRKISYASSLGGATDRDLRHIISELNGFDALAFREESAAKKVEELIGRSVATVLDPTFLLTKNEWIDYLRLHKKKEDKYVLLYTLRNPQTLLKLIKPVLAFARKKSCKVKLIAPFANVPIFDSAYEICLEYGPVEFLNALYNAETIITDSYHGTALSVNFEKDFYSISRNVGSELRKADLLGRLGLTDRIVPNAQCLLAKEHELIDYSQVNLKLNRMRNDSMRYLQSHMLP